MTVSKSPPRVTYIIATRNRASHLDRALDNVAEYLAPEDELILIDGQSTDRTVEVVADHGNLVTTFVSEPDSCEAHAFNKGLLLARGRFIKLLSDDDYVYPDAMRKVVNVLDNETTADAILCGGEFWPTVDGKTAFQRFIRLPDNVPPTPEMQFHYVRCGLGLIFRREVLGLIGGIGANYVAADGDLICRLIECRCRLRYLDINLYRGFVHPHSNVNKAAQMHRDEMLFAFRLGQWDRLFAFNDLPLAGLHHREREGLAPALARFTNDAVRHAPFKTLLVELKTRILRRFRLSVLPFRHSPVGLPDAKGENLNIRSPWTGRLR